jgi:acyl carrier protein
MDARQVIRNYILENFLFTDDQSAIEDDTSFLERGIIDSVGALEIALFLEQSFGFVVPGNEMLPENLNSVNSLVRFVERKRKGNARAQHHSPAPVALVAG